MTVEQIYPNNIHVWYIHLHLVDFDNEFGQVYHIHVHLTMTYTETSVSPCLLMLLRDCKCEETQIGNPKNGALEDDFPLQLGDFLGSSR